MGDRNDELMAELLDSMPGQYRGKIGQLHPALETILVRCEIWRQQWDIAPSDGEGAAEDYTDAGYDFLDAVDELCEEAITTAQLKDQFVKLCRDAIGVTVQWDHWRLRTEHDSKAA